ncbi:MAG TPA: D-alanyl-D-alanine carboxypeptidase family protein [Anaerovoracaceae bacterium]|nr:D-alanyl-D-alanine carboxypeptidase family protein [Anaerovoracaceae bacterium]
MKNIIYLIILALVISCVPNNYAYALTSTPQITAEAGVIIDANTGLVLFDKNKDVKLEPASITKVMTALLALENLDMKKEVIIDEETSFTEGSRIYLLKGEKVTVEDLMYALLLESANDSAVAIAKEVSGSVENFARLMNHRAKEIGAKNTNFVNPHGLHAEGHVTTAYDMALIAQEAMRNQNFRKFILTYRHVIEKTNKQPTRFLYNTNRLIYDEKTKVDASGILRPAKYDGVTGIKTGYTPEAGGCVITGAEKDGSEFIAVVLKSTDLGRFGDGITLLDFAFANYKSVVAIKGGTNMGIIKVKNGEKNKVALVTERNGGVTLPKEASEDIVNKKIVIPKSIEAPIKKGQQIGFVEIYEGDVLRDKVPVVAVGSIGKGTFLSVFGIEDNIAFKIILALKIIGGILGVLILLMVLYILYKRNQIKRKRAKRRQQMMKMTKERHVRH